MKRRASAVVVFRPDRASGRLYDRACDREAHAHTSRLRRVKRSEQPVSILRVQTRPRVSHRHVHTRATMTGRPQFEAALTLRHLRHRIEAVRDQVQEHLLQMNTIGVDPW